jgi:hypothetical protein
MLTMTKKMKKTKMITIMLQSLKKPRELLLNPRVQFLLDDLERQAGIPPALQLLEQPNL